MSKASIDRFLAAKSLKQKLIKLRQEWQSSQNKSAIASLKLTLRINGKDYADDEIANAIASKFPVASALTALIEDVDQEIATQKAEAVSFYKEQIENG